MHKACKKQFTSAKNKCVNLKLKALKLRQSELKLLQIGISQNTLLLDRFHLTISHVNKLEKQIWSINPKNFGRVKHILHENISYCISVNNREWIIFDSNEPHLVWLISLHKRDSKSMITDFISYTPGLHHPHIDQLKKILKIMDNKNLFSSECKQYKKGLPNFQILFFGTAGEFCKKHTIMHRKTS